MYFFIICCFNFSNSNLDYYLLDPIKANHVETSNNRENIVITIKFPHKFFYKKICWNNVDHELYHLLYAFYSSQIATVLHLTL